MSDLAALRRFYADEIEAVANLTTPGLVDALATVPRERFLGPGPWVVRGEADFAAAPRTTPDDDPRRVYHNCAVAIDPARQLFNGAPSLLASAIDRLQLRRGQHVLHVGTGSGYYTALLAHLVSDAGRVTGIEGDEALASTARRNLRDCPWVGIRHADGRGLAGESFDGILVNAGVTHPEPEWLDALAIGGRLIVPLTATMPGLADARRAEADASTIGKGLLILVHKQADGGLAANTLTFVTIYSAIGLRDEGMNRRLGEAFHRNPFPRFTRLRRDTHERAGTCWLHESGWCLDT
jgi:protein-L-isoaspartate(D-aspartate) O-methyltransferase